MTPEQRALLRKRLTQPKALAPELHAEGQRRKNRHSEQRRKLRRKLVAQGVPADEIERRIEAKRVEQQGKRDMENHVRRINGRPDAAYVQPDDTGYKPPAADPLLNGAARATGQTAKAVKRGKTVTKWQHEEAS